MEPESVLVSKKEGHSGSLIQELGRKVWAIMQARKKTLCKDRWYGGEGPHRVGTPSGEGGMDLDVRVVL